MNPHHYIDAFVIPIKKDKVEAYRLAAEAAAAIWMEHGALSFSENVGDDLSCHQEGIPFDKLANCESEETVIFSWIAYRSREHRDEVNAKVMSDPRITTLCQECQNIFNGNRMSCGGFRNIVNY